MIWRPLFFLVVAIAPWAGSAWAATASEVLLPATTKGYVSAAQPADLKEHFQETLVGQLVYDDDMQPFVKSLQKQIETKLGAIEEKLGFTIDDLEGVPAGELSVSMIEHKDRPAVLAVTIDVTKHQKQSERFLAAVEKRFAARGGTKKDADHSGTTFHVFTVPAADSKAPQQSTVYFVHDDVLCGVDAVDEADAILKRFTGTPTDNLKSLPAYQATMERCHKEAGDMEPEARWFIDPFAFVWAYRSLSKSPPPAKDKDYARILADQGFDAVQGVGGYLNLLAPNSVDVLYRLAIYAPPVKGKEHDPLRWNLAMQMLQLPNSKEAPPQSWAPRMSARYACYNVDVLNAYDHFGTLFDALQGHKDAFKTSMEGIEQDPYGPQVNVRKEFVGHMGKRVTLITDYSTPVSVNNERSLLAVEAVDEAKLAKSLAKIMEHEPDVKRREFGEYVLWERVPAENNPDEIEVEAPGFAPVGTPEKKLADEKEKKRVLPNSAVCVALGQLMVASDIDFLKELLQGFAQHEMLSSSGDYQQVATLMDKLAPGERSGFAFVRLDEASRATYDLIRAGKMPESESLLGKFLNDVLTTEVEKEEGVHRKQRIDGSLLPDFEMVRRYLGPVGRVLRSDDDGWLLTGAILNKEAPGEPSGEARELSRN
ncbi:MAG TPA: hypothetical protein VGI40_05695 [Pirellulaceae bacterium]